MPSTTIPPDGPPTNSEGIPDTDPSPGNLKPARVPSLPTWGEEVVTQVAGPHAHPTQSILDMEPEEVCEGCGTRLAADLAHARGWRLSNTRTGEQLFLCDACLAGS